MAKRDLKVTLCNGIDKSFSGSGRLGSPMKAVSIGISVAAVSILGSSYADASKLHRVTTLPAGYTCIDLRNKVSEYGEIVLVSAAKTRGYSDRDIWRIRKKCKV